MANLTPWFFQQFLDVNNGNIALSGGKVFFYEAGTSTKKNAFKDSTESVAHTNPMILDSNGFPPGGSMIWLGTGAYKIVVSPSNDTDPPISPIKTIDNISTSGGSGNSFTVVDTVAQARLLTGSEFDYIIISGYTAGSDDIGLRLYRWNPASTVADDGGSVIKITATATGRFELVAGTIINPKWFGATGDGSTNDYLAISNAITYIASIGGGVLQFSAGAYNFTSTLTIPATVEAEFLPGAYLKSTNTSTLTINKMNLDGLSKRFDSTIGTITLGSDVEYVYPEWFGALGDGSTDDSASIQKAFDTHNKIAFMRKTYKITSNLNVGVKREILGNGATFSPNDNSVSLLNLANVFSLNDAIKIKDLNITNAASKTGVYGLYAPRCSFLSVENLYIEGVETGIQITSGKNQNFKNISAKSCSVMGLSIYSTGIEDHNANNFTGINLESNACGLFLYRSSGNIKNVTFDGLILKDNTVNGAFFSGNLPVTLKNVWISGNGSGASSIVIGSQTVYKADLYLKEASVILKDSQSDSTLNNSIILTESSTLSHDGYTDYNSASNTHFLVDATSKIFETGVITAVGYKENVWQYGAINEVITPYICHGVGKSIQKIGRNFFAQSFPQTPNPTTVAPATEQTVKTDKFLNYEVTFSNSTGNASFNATKLTFATGMTAPYQISTLLVKSNTASAVLTFEFVDNSASYSHNITFSADPDDWKRIVFITSGKTDHEIRIYPPNTSAVKLYLADAMTWEGTLEAISEIYHECTVNLNQEGYYVDAIPTTGTWAKDDRLYRNDAFTFGYIGHVCSEAGTPGVWKDYGAVV